MSMAIYILTKAILGQGGQGIVYRTHDVDLAIIKLPLKRWRTT